MVNDPYIFICPQCRNIVRAPDPRQIFCEECLREFGDSVKMILSDIDDDE